MNKAKMPLGFLQSGCEGTVKEMHGGNNMCRRLAGLGITCGSRVRVISNNAGGPLILSVKESRLALGRGMALKIMVEEG